MLHMPSKEQENLLKSNPQTCSRAAPKPTQVCFGQVTPCPHDEVRATRCTVLAIDPRLAQNLAARSHHGPIPYGYTGQTFKTKKQTKETGGNKPKTKTIADVFWFETPTTSESPPFRAHGLQSPSSPVLAGCRPVFLAPGPQTWLLQLGFPTVYLRVCKVF